ncbi:MAG: hypothetical protein KF819_05505 [Labilithrix sp.]|nr:hypothetical protein [Labilithrix sp.]
MLTLPVVLAACPADDGPSEGRLVVGVQAEELAALVGSVRVVARIDDAVATDEIVDVQSPATGARDGLPKEIALEGRPGARVEVSVDAFGGPGGPGGPSGPGGGAAVVSRRAITRLVASQGTEGKKLLRLQLESRCAGLGAVGASGVPVPVTCAAEQTCVSGQCVSPEIAEGELEDYEPGWAGAPPDFCRPKNRGAPELILGQGQTDYAPLADGETLQLEKGPQGGHHIWIAIRMKNLRQSGSRTTLTAKLVDDPASPILPAGYVFSFDRDEGSYCKLYGLRFQLDGGAADLTQDYKRFLGKRLEVTAEVVDTTGGRAAATKTVRIADERLCADGTTTSC